MYKLPNHIHEVFLNKLKYTYCTNKSRVNRLTDSGRKELKGRLILTHHLNVEGSGP